MKTGGLDLSELEHDALTEVVNIGVSRAAAALRQMVGHQVLLSVPAVELVSPKAGATLIGEREAGSLVAVRQDFSGAFSGRALLIFPEASSLELVRAVIGADASASDIVDMEEEALAETGNIILNGCLGTMANMLQQSLSMSLPAVLRGNSTELFGLDQQAWEGGLVLVLYINFAVLKRDIRGYIAMLMDLPSLDVLKLLIGNFIERVMNDDIGTAV
jgi:chemotaxis protein CheC